MKKNLLVILWIMNCAASRGQDSSYYRNEMYAGYGLLSDMRIAFESEAFLGIITTAEYADIKGTGAFIAGYNRYLSHKFSLGGEISYQYLEMNGQYSSGEPIHNRYSFLNLMARCDYHYLNKEMVQLYSGFALGPAFIMGKWKDDAGVEDNFAPFVSYQFNFIGLRVGKEWAGFAEVGFGRNGLLNVGLSGKF